MQGLASPPEAALGRTLQHGGIALRRSAEVVGVDPHRDVWIGVSRELRRGRRVELQANDEVRRVGVPLRLRDAKTLELRVRPDMSAGEREQMLERWGRRLLRRQAGELIEKWAPVIGVDVTTWGIKRMKTRWGTCNTEARRIWINLELIKKPAPCLEYIVVHELVHLLERHHNDRFRKLMDGFMPQWRLHRDELNRAPLAHESWSY